MLSLQVNSKDKLILGAIQLPSFLCKSTNEIKDISKFAAENALLFKEGGFDGVYIQDTTPGELSLDVVSNLASITRHVKDTVGDFPIGTQMECDNAKAILAIAKSTPSDMVRIKTYVGALLKNNGIFAGQGPEAFKYKMENRIDTSIFCDIFNLTGVPLGDLSLKAACGMALNLGISGLIICGHGYDETISMLKEVKEAYPNAYVICGGNATIDNVKSILEIADGVIVSSCLKTADKKAWDIGKIREFALNARS